MTFRSSFVAHAKSQASSWVARQIRDPYVKKRVVNPVHYRSRSAFKLLEIHAQYGQFLTRPDVTAVVDLGAAPGGWSQVLSTLFGYGSRQAYKQKQKQEMKTKTKTKMLAYGDVARLKRVQDKWGTWSATPGAAVHDQMHDHEADIFDPLNIDDEVLDLDLEDEKLEGVTRRRCTTTLVAVDRLYMQPIPGVEFVQVDFLAPQSAEMIHALLKFKSGKNDSSSDGRVDVVLSDMAANASGNETRDTEASLEICNAVFEFAKQHLRTAEAIGRRKAGVLLMKHFMHPSLQQFRREKLEPCFHEVRFVKPPSSRTESREGFFLCKGWKGSECQ